MSQKKTNLSKNFSNRLKRLRGTRSWSQGQVALKVGVDPQRISKYERGVSFPTIDMIIKLAATFGVSIDYLLLDELKEEVETRIHHVKDHELFESYKQIDSLSKDKRKALSVILDSFLK